MCIYVYTHPVHHRPAQGRLLQQGSKMCMAKRHIILFNMFTNSWREPNENNQIIPDILRHNLCTISDLTVDKPWNNLSRAWKGLSRVWTRGTRMFTWCHFFCCILDPPKKEWATTWLLMLRDSLGLDSPMLHSNCRGKSASCNAARGFLMAGEPRSTPLTGNHGLNAAKPCKTSESGN